MRASHKGARAASEPDLARDRARDLQRKALARVLIEHAKHSKRPAIGEPIVYRVVAPDAVRMRGARQAHVRAAAFFWEATVRSDTPRLDTASSACLLLAGVLIFFR